MKQFSLFFFIVFFSRFIYSEDSSVKDSQKEILAYGLEGEITELIDTLKRDEEDSLLTELNSLFSSTRSLIVREALIDYYTFKKNSQAKEWALSIIDDPWDEKKSTVNVVFLYLEAISASEATASIRRILDSENPDYRDKAISLLGKIGSEEDAEYLFNLLEEETSGDEKSRLVIRQNVMTALGQLKAKKHSDRFEAIVKDEDENAVIRANAAIALGEMGNKESIPLIAMLFQEKDPLLRSAAIKSLANFDSKEAIAIILEGFKDSYYKVRLDSIAASEKILLTTAVPFLLYRAKNDPVEIVKFRSYEALGSIGVDEGLDWLSEQFLNQKTPESARIKAASVLIKHYQDAYLPSFEKVIKETLVDDKKEKFRYELLKIAISSRSNLNVDLCLSLLSHKDVTTKSFGLDLFGIQKYPEAKEAVERIARDEKQGALHRKAKRFVELEEDKKIDTDTEPETIDNPVAIE